MSIAAISQQLLVGFSATLLVFFLTLLFSLPLGLLIAFGRMSKWAPLAFLAPKDAVVSRFIRFLANIRPLQALAKIYISILRGTPLMLQLLVVCYSPYYVLGIPLSRDWRFFAVVIGFVINYAAYFAEIYRSGIESIPVGQYEAADVLGYSKSQTFLRIIFPQMVKRILPPVTNEIITLVKDTSLAFVLAYIELFTLAKQIAAAQTSIVPLFVAGVFYFVFNALVAFVMERIEKMLSYYR